MTEYEKLLDKMHFTIGTTLMDNHMCRTGSRGPTYTDEEIRQSNQRTFVELKVMMMRLERELFGEKNYEEDETEISNRNPGASENTENGGKTTRSPRVGDFSC